MRGLSKGHILRDLERKFDKDHTKPTDIDEVSLFAVFLFLHAGKSHSLTFIGVVRGMPLRYVFHDVIQSNIVHPQKLDVGGGSVDNETTTNLARIPLRWMIRECFRTNSGIMFDCEGLRNLGLEPNALYPQVLPRPPPLSVPPTARIRNIPAPKSSTQADKERALNNFAEADVPTEVVPRKTEEELELADALSPIYDQLKLAWFWWILEFWPIRQRYQRSDNTWASYLGWNMGKGRFIPKQKSRGVRVHRSVKLRMDALHENGQKYEPKAAFDLARTTWVD